MTEHELIVMKFGGSSIANAGRINHVANIVESHYRTNDIVVVVSAMQGVTDKLLASQSFGEIQQIGFNHLLTAQELKINPISMDYMRFKFDNYLDQVRDVFPISNLDPLKNRKRDLVGALGERFSHCLLAATLCRNGIDGINIDAANVIVTSSDFGKAHILMAETAIKAKSNLSPLLDEGFIPVVTGYFGATVDGEIATLDRGGSDYTASALAALLNANRLILWKEVDGIYSDDPNKNCLAVHIPWLPYEKAHQMALDESTKILHEETIRTLMDMGVIVQVKDTFRPSRPGSVICAEQLWKSKYEYVYNSYHYWEIS